MNSTRVAVKERKSKRSLRRNSPTSFTTSARSVGATVKITGRLESLANTTAFSVLPSVNVALELPVLMVIVAVGASSPYRDGGAS